MEEHTIGTQEQWQAQRDELLKRRRSSRGAATSWPRSAAGCRGCR